MDYNEKLEKLINQAKSEGFEYTNGKFIDTKKNYVKVINVRAGTIGVGESNGEMEIFDKLYILSDEDYDKLISLKKNMQNDDILDCVCDMIDNYHDEDWMKCHCIETIINCYSDLYLYEEEYTLTQKSINHECHLQIFFDYLEEYFMNIQVLNIPTDVYEKHKQLYITSYPINRNC